VRRHQMLSLPVAALLLWGVALLPGQDAPSRTVLLNVTRGQIPSDVGSGDKTQPEIVDNFKELGGGKALKVAFAPGDSFGTKGGGTRDWKRFTALRFDAFVPGKAPVALELTVFHSRSTNYQTRVVVPIQLTAGKNEVKLGIGEMTNANNSAPDLANVARWYIADVQGKSPTVYFSDIWLEGAESSPAPGPAAASGGGVVGYKIKGKVGGLDVDLTVTPFMFGATPVRSSVLHGDPARGARIRATRMPRIDKPIMFDTPEADAICSALEVFPEDNPWNLTIEDWPLHPNSKGIIGSMGANKPFRYNDDMGFILIPPDQKKIDFKITAYANESDKGPWPVPDNTPSKAGRRTTSTARGATRSRWTTCSATSSTRGAIAMCRSLIP
jgi:hypothetical protein